MIHLVWIIPLILFVISMWTLGALKTIVIIIVFAIGLIVLIINHDKEKQEASFKEEENEKRRQREIEENEKIERQREEKRKQTIRNELGNKLQDEVFKRFRQSVIHVIYDTSILMDGVPCIKPLIDKLTNTECYLRIGTYDDEPHYIHNPGFIPIQHHHVISTVYKEIKNQEDKWNENKCDETLPFHKKYLTAKNSLTYLKELAHKHKEFNLHLNEEYTYKNPDVFKYHEVGVGFNSIEDGIIISKAVSMINDTSCQFNENESKLSPNIQNISLLLSSDMDVKQIVVEDEFHNKLYSNHNNDWFEKLYKQIIIIDKRGYLVDIITKKEYDEIQHAEWEKEFRLRENQTML